MRLIQSLTMVVAATCLTLPALAQGGGGAREGAGGDRQRGGGQFGVRLSEEDQNAAWKLQVNAFAAGETLDEETTTSLTEIYTKARESQREAMGEFIEKMREQMRERMQEGGGGAAGDRRGGGGGGGAGGDRRGGGGAGGAGGRGFGDGAFQEELQKLNETTRKELKTSMQEILEGDQLDKAVKLFGSFDGQWDATVNAISQLELDEAMTFIALWPVETYQLKVAEAREENADDRQAMFAAMQEARAELNGELEKILSEDQMKEVQSALRPQRGRRGGGGGR